jgi:DNA-binding winged helix-turn-helix (wHTH) protein/pimeloyl-ACP methyl ester carboxylesterase
MTRDADSVYEFGRYRLEVRERRLLCDGKQVPLRTKVFDTLRLLVDHAGRLLTKDELMQAIWPDTIVEENNLNQTISALRRALGDGVGEERYIETVPRVGYRFVADVTPSGPAATVYQSAPPAGPALTAHQIVRFCTTGDGIRIAYSAVGSGPPLVKAANWLNHLEYEWQSPVWRHWIAELSRQHVLVRYDERGCGLSDWNVPDLSFDCWVRDLDSVVNALNVERFALLGISQGGAVAAAYAARHPDRVSHLILCGAYARGWQFRDDEHAVEARSALIKLTRLGWGRSNPAFQRIFTTRFIPDATAREMEWFDDLQRISSSPENAARLMEESARVDVRPLLAEIRVPTIVFHSRDDRAVPFAEGCLLAAGIPGARFVPVPSRNHVLLEHEPGWQIFLRETEAFLGCAQ